MTQLKRKSRIRNAWYISFIIILVISMAAALSIYLFALEAINEQTQETNRAMLQLVRQTMESSVNSVDEMAETLSLSREFAAIRAMGPDLTTDQRYQLYAYGRTLQTSFVFDLPVLYHAVYLKKSRLMLNNSYQKLEQSYESYFKYSSLSYEAYASLLDEPHERDYVAMPMGPTPVILCLRSLPYANDSFDANIVVAISTQAVMDVLTKAGWRGDGVVCMLDRNDALLLCSDETKITQNMLSLPAGENEVKVDGRRYLCLSQESAGSGLKYLYIAPYDSIYQKASLLRTLAVICMGLGLLAGLAATVVLVRRNYRPVERIMSRLSGQNHAGNEYDFILQSIEEGQNVQETLKQQLEEQSARLKASLLERLLTGRLSYNANTCRMLESQGIVLDRPRYAVLSAGAAAFYDSFSVVTKNAAEVMTHELQVRVSGLTVYWAAGGLAVTLLLGFNEDQAGKLEEAVEAMRREVLSSYNLELTLGLSQSGSDAAQVSELFRQAGVALEYGQTHAGGSLTCYPKQSGQGDYCFSVEDEMALIQAVRDGSAEKGRAVLETVLEKYGRHVDLVTAQCLRFDLIAACLRLFAYADSAMPREAWQGEDAVRRLMATDALPELVNNIGNLLDRLCAALLERRNLGRNSLSEQIIAFVGENWTREDLSVASVAEHLNMHPSYVSRLFKEERGMGLLEYINRYRVDQAAIMLLETSLPVTQVAQRCGYTSDASFIRVFKQYRGMTPGRFREENAA